MSKISKDLVNKIKGRSKSNIAGVFFMELMTATIQTHIFHLMTDSYAQHMALGGFYEGLPGIIDALVEVYQGDKEVIKKYPTSLSITNEYNPVKYLTNLRDFIDSNKEKVCMRSNFLNQVDLVFDLIDSTLYKLKNLK